VTGSGSSWPAKVVSGRGLQSKLGKESVISAASRGSGGIVVGPVGAEKVFSGGGEGGGEW